MKIVICALVNFFILTNNLIFSQELPSSVLHHELLKFKETKRILYLAAHPDDENTRLISYLVNGEHAEVGYLSLTRGDGGQNLIGKELGIGLGMIRTNELLKARETDGGRQFFTRAIDFGFSKTPDETLNNWDQEKLLSDVVWIIRNFQPDIIINRFTTTPGITHGQHTASAILAAEAFKKSGDKNIFPEQLKWTQTWQPKRLFWNASNFGGQFEPKIGKLYHTFSVGGYNPLLGISYSQIAANSRTMHKSQGFGSTAQIGEGFEMIELIDGDTFEESAFEGIPNRWNELKEGKVIQEQIDLVLNKFDFAQPIKTLPDLLKLKAIIETQESEAEWLIEKKTLLNEIILKLLGIKTEFIIRKEIGYPGEKISSQLIFNNPSEIPVTLQSFQTPMLTTEINHVSVSNKLFSTELELVIPLNHPVSQPYWLENPLDGSHYDIPSQELVGMPISDPSIAATLTMSLAGQELDLMLPLIYKYNDQVDGELKQPFTIVPEINVSLDKSNVFLIEGADNHLKAEITFKDKILPGNVILEGLLPDQYKILGEQVDESKKQINYTIQLLKSDVEKQEVILSFVSSDGRKFNQDIERIFHKHIPNLTYFHPSSFGLIALDIKTSKQKVGYINGAGDDVADVLRDLGYQVTNLDNGNISKEKLAEFSTIVVGIRAFNVNQSLANNIDQLMDYVYEGGNLIIQYNTSSPLLTRKLGPYSFSLSRDRVAVEDSPVQADLSHPVFSFPHQIVLSDFDDWVQERGLYFTSDWSEEYSSPLTLKDPDEDPSKGALLFTKYGKGTYTYSGISWFRQLPSGVPGAVKIFVNLIEQAGGR